MGMGKKPIPTKATLKQRSELVDQISQISRRATFALCDAMNVSPDLGLVIQAHIDAAASLCAEDLLHAGLIRSDAVGATRNKLHAVMLKAWSECVESYGATVTRLKDGGQRAAEEN